MALELNTTVDKAFEDHLAKLVEVLCEDHNPFFTSKQNDDAISRFEAGLQHALKLREVILDRVKKLTEKQVTE
jgi:hypothetical protein